MAQTAIPGLEVIDPDMDRMARRMRSPVATPDVMYGTPHGVALDPGAAEAVRRYTPRSPAPTMRDVVPYNRPNWTTPGPTPPAPNTALAPSSRPNFTMPGAAPQPQVDFDMGPGNANVPKGGSVEARTFRAPPNSGPQMPVAPAVTPEAGTPMQRAMRSMRSPGTTKALHGASIPGVVGALTGVQQSAADSLAPEAAPFVPPPAKPGDIPIDPSVVAPKPVQQHPLGFGPDNEFTRNLANTANAVSGLGRGVGAGVASLANTMRAGSTAGVAATKAAPFVQGVAPFVQGAQAGQSATAGAFGPGATPNMTTPAPAAGADPSIGPPVLAPRRDGVIYREGNSYSGTGNIGFGAEIDNARNPGVGVTSLPAAPGMRGGYELPRSVTTGDGGSTVGMGPIGFYGEREGGTANFGPSLSVLGPSGNAMKPRDVRAANAIAAERAIASERMANERNLARMREGGDMARANLNAGVQRENNAAQISATMRGQDITREGHMVTAQGNRMRMQYDMAKDQRDYTTGRADKAFEQGQQAIKDLHQEIGSMIPPTTDQDGKTVPDTQNAARYATAMQALVGRMGKTMKDVDAKDKARFVAGMQLADVVTATATGSMTPWGTRAIQSNEPILALRKLPNGDYQTNRVGVNGETEIIPGRYIEKEGSTLGFGGRASNKFASLME